MPLTARKASALACGSLIAGGAGLGVARSGIPAMPAPATPNLTEFELHHGSSSHYGIKVEADGRTLGEWVTSDASCVSPVDGVKGALELGDGLTSYTNTGEILAEVPAQDEADGWYVSNDETNANYRTIGSQNSAPDGLCSGTSSPFFPDLPSRSLNTDGYTVPLTVLLRVWLHSDRSRGRCHRSALGWRRAFR
jgi:hypothetical protein